MSDSDYKKYWYIKLPKEFFNRHDIKILESQPNGKDYCLFYLKLLLESVTHNGELRFNEAIPYDENMLSVVTNTNIDIVRSAMKVLYQLKLIELWDDKTLYMTEVQKMMGYDTGMALRSKEYRQRKKLELGSNEPKTNPIRTESKSNSKSKSNSIELELDLKENKNKENYTEPELLVTAPRVREFLDSNRITANYYSLTDYINENKISNWQDYILNEFKKTNDLTFNNVKEFIKQNNLEVDSFEVYKDLSMNKVDNWRESLLSKYGKNN